VIVYFDSSALVKLLVAEDGSTMAQELWDARRLSAASVLAYVETRAALAHAQRLGRISGERLRRGMATLDGIWRAIRTIALDDRLAKVAGAAAEAHGLRGGDEVHLASALSIQDPGVVFATWDRTLSRAARGVGYHVVP
jgi:predicted nucleic acid-binding protein